MAGDPALDAEQGDVLPRHQGAVPRLQACPLQPTHRGEEAQRWAQQAGSQVGHTCSQQGPASRADSLRSMHSLPAGEGL